MEPKPHWRVNTYPARFWHYSQEHDRVYCELCPRHCKLKAGQKGFCRVRGNELNEMKTYNYGISVQATEECIETEAIYHFRPGSRILSMGNVGCMLSCQYCQNWQTSQVKYLNDNNVWHYSPQEVIDLALANNIGVISWTYNDPVVWQEFVVDTSRLAAKNGIRTLYKSALYIERQPLKELLDVIDIFSISLKCMNDEIYIKYFKGRLEPVLRAISQIAETDRHLEISQLVVTGLNDDGVETRKTARWLLDHLRREVPLHLVGYHPAFRYGKERTTVDTLLSLRGVVLTEGIRYCYLGNVYADDVSNTNCQKCGNRLVQRFGLTTSVTGLDQRSCCLLCGERSPITEPVSTDVFVSQASEFHPVQQTRFEWTDEINSVHIFVSDSHDSMVFEVERLPEGKVEKLAVRGGLERIIVSKSASNEKGVVISTNTRQPVRYLPVLDRAHFPVRDKVSQSESFIN